METATEVWVVQTAHKQVSRFAIFALAELPQVGDDYSTDEGVVLGLRVQRRRLHPVDDSDTLWELEVQYSTKTKDQDEQDEEPLDRQPEIAIDFETYQTVAEGALVDFLNDEDAPVAEELFFGRALTNSAGEPFDPQPEMDQVRPVLTVTYNESFLNIPLLMHYANTVNSTVWLGCQPRTWKMGGPRISREIENGIKYWQISLTFTYNKQTWDLQILNQGTYFIDGGGDKQPFTDSPGNRIVGLLDDDGFELAEGADPTFERYRVYKETDFNNIFTEAIFQ